jgi:signal transduction histidine kinase
VEQRNVRPSALTDNDTVVATRNDFRVFFDTVLRIAPDTTTIAVVNGNSPLERFWLQELRKEVSGYEGRLKFIWYSAFSFEDILRHAAALPPHSAIFWQLMNVDAAGVSHEGDKALRRLHAVANAPIFSYQEALFGPHMVGGPLHSIAAPSQQAAAVGVRLLRGERAGDIAPIAIDFSTYRFNWKELQRWGLSAARLPVGSDVVFREPSLWEKHGEFVVPVSLVLLGQCVMIAWLLREHRQRRRSESAAHELSGRLIFAQEDERARLARELHDDVTQRLALLAIEAGNEERNPKKPETTAAARTMREKLVRLSDDVHALSYRLHPSILEDLGLTEALRSECERFSRTFPIRLTADIPDLEPNVPRGTALCIFRIAQEALRNIARHSGATRATISLRELGDALDLVVSDNGSGFDASRSRPGRSLGHTGMRQRAFLLGGKVDISSGPGRGTSVRARIPVLRERHEQAARVAG